MVRNRFLLYTILAVFFAFIYHESKAKRTYIRNDVVSLSNNTASQAPEKKRKENRKEKSNKTEQVEKERETELRDVYLFGVSCNFQDSVTYFTNITPIRKAVFDKATGFIDGIRLYTEQLENYLLQKGHMGYISTTFYAKSMKAAEKIYAKLRKKIAKKSYTRIEPIADFNYQFVSPENIYRNVIQPVSEEDMEEEE